MKYIVFSILIGLCEFFALITLYEAFDLALTAAILVTGTLLGVIFLLLSKPRYIKYKLMDKNVLKQIVEKAQKNPATITSREQRKLEVVAQGLIYIISIVLIFIPGIVTDAVGIILLIPAVSRANAIRSGVFTSNSEV